MSAVLDKQAIIDARRPEILRKHQEQGMSVWQNYLSAISELGKKRFNAHNELAAPAPRFFINRHPVCTPGNLTNLIGQAKTAKSAVVGAMIAATIRAEQGTQGDTLGITATAPGIMQLVHIDTEQSPYDHDQLLRRALRRAGVIQEPDWLASYALAGFTPNELRKALKHAIKHAEYEGGAYAVIIDGAADMVNDVNDAEESNAFVAELHALAIQFDCPIISVVHENPGQDYGKMRGHFGSQLERKAESNLRLKKVEETTVVFSEKMRRAPILERDGPRFAWSDEAGMHVSVATAGQSRDDAKRAELIDLATEAFGGKGSMKFTDMTVAIESARGCSRRTAERKVEEMKRINVIRLQGFGLYVPTTDKAPTD